MKDTNSTRRGIQWEDLNQIESDVIPGPSVSETVRVVKQRCSSASSRSIAYNLATPSQYSMAGFSRPLPDSRYNTIAEALNQDASPTESPKITTSTPPTVLSFPLSLIEQYDQKGWTPQHGASHKKATTSARPKSAKSTRSMNGGIIGIHHHGPGSRAPSPIPRFDNTQSRPQSAKSSTPANPVTDDLPNRHDSKKLIEVDVKAMYTATESHLQTYELFPQELLAIRKAMQSTGQCTAAHTHHHKDKSRIAENIAKFKERAWKDTFEEEDLMIDDINEEFLAVILGEEVVKAGKERHMIEEMKKQKEEEGQLDMHGHFMKKVRECVVVGSRPVSAASVRTGFSSVRTATTATSMNCGASARPTSAKSLASISSSTSGGLSSSSSRPIGGGTTASFRAKMRPRVFAKHESFTSEDRKLADTSYSLDDERKLRPKSAPPVPVSKHGCTTIAKNMNEFKQVQAYFKLNNNSLGQSQIFNFRTKNTTS
ncbi:hypothetical protein BCR33DRAFT_428855 [Rhizoclosmatium globosum]|uniref:Uncharacterized protein n=1 Tax=Rhizoclosmatium globosum TaxID=329046 RepID=A0A1Y2BW35_9FUNG|nr:hypothetical protein BCR33DRAFT_428855 [Rhizoclosmatium globosum]|eukprot:ORY38345.1 hypothetical protein BCR33DRAFT_428855 [Rhizoclosmatium globosum]